MSQVKCYAISIESTEVIEDMKRDMKTGKSRALELRKMPGFVGVNPDGDCQYLLFINKEDRDNSFEKVKKLFETAKIVEPVAMVDERYIRPQKVH